MSQALQQLANAREAKAKKEAQLAMLKMEGDRMRESISASVAARVQREQDVQLLREQIAAVRSFRSKA